MSNSILELLAKFYSLNGTLQKLPGDEDLNFKLSTSDNKHFIVKLMRPDCPSDLIDLQCSTLQHLESKSLSIQIPKVILSKEGKTFELVNVDAEHRILWILTWCPGNLFSKFKPHTLALMHSFGQAIGQLTVALEGFTHPDMKRGHRWELTEALQVKDYAQHVQGETKPIIEQVFNKLENEILPKLQKLPYSVIHNDANDFNVLIGLDSKGQAHISGIFDFGDMGFQPTICELAIALAYAIMGKKHPLRICYQFLSGYTSVRSLSEAEIDVLFDLIKTRLAVSVAISSQRQIEEDDPYITISQEPAKNTLKQLDKIPAPLAKSFFRLGSKFSAIEDAEHIYQYLLKHGKQAKPVIKVDSFDGILDLSASSLMLGANPKNVHIEHLTKQIDGFMSERKIDFAFGRYCESRRLYAAANFGASGHPTQEKRTNHLGLDIFCEAGTPVYVPFEGTVIVKTNVQLPLDYGGMIMLQHETDLGKKFYTLYGHLKPESLELEVGDTVKAGDQIATLGAPHENGGWPPHLHLQVMLDLVGLGKDFPGVAFQNEIEIWKSLCPNPMLLFNVPDISAYDATINYEKILKDRKEKIGYNLSLTYAKPLHIVAGFRQFLYDSHARTYLDFYNNVPHVGHQHPTVVKAIQKQAAMLNTNTRYLHENILNYAERLTAKLPDHLEVCYFTNSATEANELAIRMARNYTGRKDVMVVEAAYHGHTSTLIDISPYKHDGPGGKGAPDWVHKVPIADDYRGKFKRNIPNAGHLFANEIKAKIESLEANGQAVSAFIAETYPSVGGQIIPPKDYLKEVYQHVRNHGGICIADEVQTGFGRLGKSFWAFETQGVLPDMIVLGKPIGNGFPLAAVISTKAIAESFNNGMEYFSTYGGNPIACAAGLAVLDVIEEEQLQENAVLRGQQIIKTFVELKERFELIGDIRGEGLFLGVELVRSRETLEPAAAEASYIINRLKDYGILAGTDGPLHNVIKLRPSMVVEESDIEYFRKIIEGIFEEIFLKIDR